jgi:hypothetical protein
MKFALKLLLESFLKEYVYCPTFPVHVLSTSTHLTDIPSKIYIVKLSNLQILT